MGIHYGDYVAGCESEALSTVNLTFMMVPFQVGIPLRRWTRSLYCMLQKLRQPYVTKLRIVQLDEVDFNIMSKKILVRRLVWHSGVHGINGHQLFESRKGKSTYDSLVVVRVIYDMA